MQSIALISLHTSPLIQPGSGDGGGMNVYVRELAMALAHRGVRCDVYTRRTSLDQPDEVVVEPGFRVRAITAGAPDLAKEDLPAILDQFTDAMAVALQDDPVDGLHANYWLSADVGHRLKHRLGLPLAVTFHTLGSVKRATGDPEPQFRIDAEDAIIGCSDAVFASCDTEAFELIEHHDAPAERIEIMPPGVDHAFFSPGQQWAARQALGLTGDRPLMLFVGRLQPLKGVELAIEALAGSRHAAELVVVGGPSGADGERYVDSVKKLAADLGVADRVRWHPPQPHHLLSTYYRAADVCVVPSRSESFGLVALEASACATPVVASDVGGLGTIVDDGRTGVLVDERSGVAFASAVDSVLDDPIGAMAMGAAAYDRSQLFTWSKAAETVTSLFDRLASRELVDCR